MNPSDIPPLIAAMTFMILGAGVILLRPLTRRLGDLLEVMVTDRRRAAATPPPDPRLHETLSRIEERLRMLEERQDFTDSLLARSTARPVLAARHTGPVTQPGDLPADTQG